MTKINESVVDLQEVTLNSCNSSNNIYELGRTYAETISYVEYYDYDIYERPSLTPSEAMDELAANGLEESVENVEEFFRGYKDYYEERESFFYDWLGEIKEEATCKIKDLFDDFYNYGFDFDTEKAIEEIAEDLDNEAQGTDWQVFSYDYENIVRDCFREVSFIVLFRNAAEA